MNNILKVEGLSKSYGDFSLTDVTFSLPEECITGFIGINGAGKTTPIRSLICFSFLSMSRPKNWILPELLLVNPKSVRNVVVLPAPLIPIKPVIHSSGEFTKN